MAVILGNTQYSELANAVTAGAFAHYIWLVPILIGLIPLAA